jgi:hypothetical protein
LHRCFNFLAARLIKNLAKGGIAGEIKGETLEGLVDGVGAILVSGRPISFQTDLYSPLFVPRPTVEMERFASLRPPEYSGPISNMNVGGVGGGGGGGQFGIAGGAFGLGGGGFNLGEQGEQGMQFGNLGGGFRAGNRPRHSGEVAISPASFP